MKKVNVYSVEDMAEALREEKKKNERVSATLKLVGEFFFENFHEGKSTGISGGKNIFTLQGRNNLLDTVFGATNKSLNWYLGIFKGNYTPTASNTAANSLGIGNLYNECQDADYTPAGNRPAYILGSASDGSISNANNKAEFTFLASLDIYGGFVVNSASKTSASGVLMAAKRFNNAPRTVDISDISYGWYVLTLVSG